MANQPVLSIVGTACQPKDEAKFNRWYNEVHIPMLLKYKGLLGSARYQITDPAQAQPKYIALYRFAGQKEAEGMNKSPEFQAAIKEMQESWGNGIEIKYASNYAVIKEFPPRKGAVSSRPVINIVSTRCAPPDEAGFNRWYNEVHIPLIMKSDKVLSVTRYQQLGPEPGPAYLAIYHFGSLKDFQEFSNSPEMAAAGQEMRQSWGQKFQIVFRVQYELIKQW
jgi:hypothetical protein